MDNLEMLFKYQENLQKELGYNLDEMTIEERVAYIKEYVLHMEHEAHEMLQELPYFKAWKKYPTEPIQQAQLLEVARKEWADVVHFFLNVSLALGFTPEQLVYTFIDKNMLNRNRQQDPAFKKCTGDTNETNSFR